jgi:hypothetical protein
MIKKLKNRKTFKPELNYMTPAEMKIFQNMVISGEITFFKMSRCVTCGKDIVNGKKYCSIGCSKIEEVGGE